MQIKIKLNYPHKHAGVSYAAGAEITVPLHDAIWLKAADLIETEWTDIEAAAKKLVTKDNPKPYAEEIASAKVKQEAVASAKSAAAEGAALAVQSQTAGNSAAQTINTAA